MSVPTDFKSVSDASVNQADFEVNRLAARVPSGTTIEHVMHPLFFRNVLSRLRPRMQIIVLSDDLELDCEVRVERITQSTAHVRLLRNYEVPDEDMRTPATLPPPVVDFGGPKHQWRFGMPTGKGVDIVKHGFSSEKEAWAAAKEYYATLTSAPMPELAEK
ncbi:hypothetical protein [Agrobacterium vitis]|uniref:hypothetical protein n=1 Tax=Agrobacterium vitis TaxID=373 RepID=UPI000872583F|nr:hypothetical protein [Agrobacterium vitis]MCM2452951.1 hypothetical protein [Agrobacterium vitis]MCM2471112.1 hypothetical protein [Agrobacterium vitis]MUO70105.1 hypothetical protein [Agrobacterium vitis]